MTSDTTTYEYDVFISYTTSDRDWVSRELLGPQSAVCAGTARPGHAPDRGIAKLCPPAGRVAPGTRSVAAGARTAAPIAHAPAAAWSSWTLAYLPARAQQLHHHHRAVGAGADRPDGTQRPGAIDAAALAGGAASCDAATVHACLVSCLLCCVARGGTTAVYAPPVADQGCHALSAARHAAPGTVSGMWAATTNAGMAQTVGRVSAMSGPTRPAGTARDHRHGIALGGVGHHAGWDAGRTAPTTAAADPSSGHGCAADRPRQHPHAGTGLARNPPGLSSQHAGTVVHGPYCSDVDAVDADCSSAEERLACGVDPVAAGAPKSRRSCDLNASPTGRTATR